MNATYPTIDEPATPEYLLAVLRDMHRQQSQIDPEADPDAVLTPETTVAEWRKARDLLGWRELAIAYNVCWGIACSFDQWREVLEPAARKPLWGVCQLIAQYPSRPRIRPARLLGHTCATAGAFLTIRSLLHKAGASAEEIVPSTPLAPYARRHTMVFLDAISRLAPGALPAVRIRTPVHTTILGGALAGRVGLGLGGYAEWPLLTIAGGALFALCYALGSFAAHDLPPACVEFGELRTFRDLEVVVAAGKWND
jgi:hypothetical protein